MTWVSQYQKTFHPLTLCLCTKIFKVVRALYFIQCGCLPVLNLRLRPAQTSIERLREQFCTNNFYEVSETVAKTKATIPTRLQDIFMEQGQ